MVDASVAASAAASAAASVTSNGVFPVASARWAAGAPASAAGATAAAAAVVPPDEARGTAEAQGGVPLRLRWTGQLRVMVNPWRRPRHNRSGIR